MNEKYIWELWSKCKHPHPEYGGGDMIWPMEFAELIVKECLAHGKLTQSQTVVNGSEEYNAGREMGVEVFMNQIKKHFGVEE